MPLDLKPWNFGEDEEGPKAFRKAAEYGARLLWSEIEKAIRKEEATFEISLFGRRPRLVIDLIADGFNDPVFVTLDKVTLFFPEPEDVEDATAIASIDAAETIMEKWLADMRTVREECRARLASTPPPEQGQEQVHD